MLDDPEHAVTPQWTVACLAPLFCRIDIGWVPVDLARPMAQIHSLCDIARCRVLRRALETLYPDRYPPEPDVPIAVPTVEIEAAVARVTAARAALAAATGGTAGDLQEQPEVRAATAELDAALAEREELFGRACPAEGIVPVALVRLFDFTAAELSRFAGPRVP
ncbi:hypothetical protein EBN03_03970 [Nocardia stercoris]|uniref:Uncharacterized protein n=1 Tax=Nocardia stercoris TaxID=2483361 RepID=A0A3M2LF38_9NOCA|nr:hypothetical protein EBN03_03970 [Nocardia stercoris]